MLSDSLPCDQLTNSARILMKWDCRSVKSASLPYEESPEDPTVAFMQSKRARGITSLAFGPNASTVYGLGADAIPYTYLTHSLQAIPTPNSSTQQGGSISFSSKLSVSPCGRWLATSGADSHTNLYEIPCRSRVINRECAVQLNNHAREVTGLSWAGNDTVRSVSSLR
jgi:WD40 repeat protein